MLFRQLQPSSEREYEGTGRVAIPLDMAQGYGKSHTEWVALRRKPRSHDMAATVTSSSNPATQSGTVERNPFLASFASSETLRSLLLVSVATSRQG